MVVTVASCKSILEERYRIKLIWFDSFGAKSSCTLIENELLIDPGAAAMQPSYPLPADRKRELRHKALNIIERIAEKPRLILITHYHYDHYVRPWDTDIENPEKIYLGNKTIILKDPNRYINESQWKRSRKFIEAIAEMGGLQPSSIYDEPQDTSNLEDPIESLHEALSRSYGDYTLRRKELLEKGRKWFEKLRSYWSKNPWIKKRIVLPRGAEIIIGDNINYNGVHVKVKLLGPWFHGVEYDRTGWVVPVLIESAQASIIYTSDLMGPIVEDYASMIIDLKPRVIIADGPPTYLFPYMFNKINLERAVDNMSRIIREANPDIVIYDHHLVREKRWRERVRRVLREAEREGVMLVTAAECYGRRPLIDVL